MRTVRMRAPARDSRRATGKRGAVPRSRLPGLRWVPMPLALLGVALGLLAVGSVQGQAAASHVAQPDQAGGLALSVTTMLWMSNDMSGMASGPGATGNYSMPDSMMPGMQPAGENRLRIEVSLSNVSTSAQRYSTTDFTLISPDRKTWKVDGQGHSDIAGSADLQPGYATTIDVYFDLPASESKHLILKWSRGGTTVSVPVRTDGAEPGPMRM